MNRPDPIDTALYIELLRVQLGELLAPMQHARMDPTATAHVASACALLNLAYDLLDPEERAGEHPEAKRIADLFRDLGPFAQIMSDER